MAFPDIEKVQIDRSCDWPINPDVFLSEIALPGTARQNKAFFSDIPPEEGVTRLNNFCLIAMPATQAVYLERQPETNHLTLGEIVASRSIRDGEKLTPGQFKDISLRRLGHSMTQFFAEITSEAEALGIAQELAELGQKFVVINQANFDAGPGFHPDILRKRIPIEQRFREIAVPLYLRLREIGYSHGDLAL